MFAEYFSGNAVTGRGMEGRVGNEFFVRREKTPARPLLHLRLQPGEKVIYGGIHASSLLYHGISQQCRACRTRTEDAPILLCHEQILECIRGIGGLGGQLVCRQPFR